jgi:hypothetical protein
MEKKVMEAFRPRALRPPVYKVFHRSNHMYELKHFGMVWQRHIQESVAGLRESLISSPFAKFAKD